MSNSSLNSSRSCKTLKSSTCSCRGICVISRHKQATLQAIQDQTPLDSDRRRYVFGRLLRQERRSACSCVKFGICLPICIRSALPQSGSHAVFSPSLSFYPLFFCFFSNFLVSACFCCCRCYHLCHNNNNLGNESSAYLRHRDDIYPLPVALSFIHPTTSTSPPSP